MDPMELDGRLGAAKAGAVASQTANLARRVTAAARDGRLEAVALREALAALFLLYGGRVLALARSSDGQGMGAVTHQPGALRALLPDGTELVTLLGKSISKGNGAVVAACVKRARRLPGACGEPMLLVVWDVTRASRRDGGLAALAAAGFDVVALTAPAGAMDVVRAAPLPPGAGGGDCVLTARLLGASAAAAAAPGMRDGLERALLAEEERMESDPGTTVMVLPLFAPKQDLLAAGSGGPAQVMAACEVKSREAMATLGAGSSRMALAGSPANMALAWLAGGASGPAPFPWLTEPLQPPPGRIGALMRVSTRQQVQGGRSFARQLLVVCHGIGGPRNLCCKPAWVTGSVFRLGMASAEELDESGVARALLYFKESGCSAVAAAHQDRLARGGLPQLLAFASRLGLELFVARDDGAGGVQRLEAQAHGA
jgi:hypothetical protein